MRRGDINCKNENNLTITAQCERIKRDKELHNFQLKRYVQGQLYKKTTIVLRCYWRFAPDTGNFKKRR